MPSKTIHDSEFGDITVKFYDRSESIKFRVDPRGHVTISAPTRTPLLFLRSAVNTGRDSIRSLLANQRRDVNYDHDQQVGKSHQLRIIETTLSHEKRVTTKDRTVLVYVTSTDELSDRNLQAAIQKEVIKAYRKEAKAYLPRRLEFLARQTNLSYESTRLTHAGSRWGSCSSSGTISLNIALMKLDVELIDYVLYHELSHTRHMNHSPDFWALVATFDPHYKVHQKRLKNYSPSL